MGTGLPEGGRTGLLPIAKSNRHGIDADFVPPCGFVPPVVNLAMMNAA